MRRRVVMFFALLSLAAFFGGCRKLSRYLPATTIDAPKSGTPEALVYDAMKAAYVAKESGNVREGWDRMRPLMHSRVLEMRTSEESFINNNFAAFSRKVDLLTIEDGKPAYKLDYVELDEELNGMDWRMRLFVLNSHSDKPSPFRVERDAEANDAWRIVNVP